MTFETCKMNHPSQRKHILIIFLSLGRVFLISYVQFARTPTANIFVGGVKEIVSICSHINKPLLISLIKIVYIILCQREGLKKLLSFSS
jgi:hypothetical protein